ncbi:MAG: hypothetical protein K9L61_02240 [Candidatus Omnitrophica bacterium]|nr:hypothetical protein [Candidatus Omnitrophota bacterium]
MPNIEIYGMGVNEATSMKKRIFDLFREDDFLDEMVVTIRKSIVEDYRGRAMPFIRLTTTPQSFIPKIVKKLKTLNLDLEIQQLKSFYPSSYLF